MPVKITDIAKEAGVSTATVVRVLHKNGYVSEAAREQVEAAVKKLGYVPNAMARALKSKRSGIIGSLVLGNENDLYRKINQYIIEAAERRGYQLITIQGRPDQRDEEQIINQFIGMQVDGLAIISDVYITTEQLDRLHKVGIPTVAVERTYDHPFTDCIEVKDWEGTYRAAKQMLDAGHRRIALICSEVFGDVERRRLEGFRQALEEAGIFREQQLICQVPRYSPLRSKREMEELIAMPVPPTAVVCTSDILASGAMQAMYQAGKRVPDDFSIVGYDNVLAERLSPPIDSVDLELTTIGETIFSLMERRRQDPDCAPKTELLDTVYISRGTIKQR